jgi:hypothetical protein
VTFPGQPPAPLYDLRSFFRTVGAPTPGGVLNRAPIERLNLSEQIEVVDAHRAPLTGAPLPVAGFVDGVQASVVVTYREHRPVYLTYQAAGAVGPGAALVGLKERLTLLASVADRDWLEEVNVTAPPLPVQQIAALDPLDIERAAYLSVGDARDRLERTLVEELVDAGTGPLVVDGSLRDRPYHHALHAVVKDVTATQYLPDERALFGLPVGWRSPVFKIPAGRAAGAVVDRFSCYVRLHDATERSWNFGLIRLEAYEPDQLMALGVLALSERQSPRSGDGRWDRHLASVAVTEKVLRARRPNVFDF